MSHVSTPSPCLIWYLLLILRTQVLPNLSIFPAPQTHTFFPPSKSKPLSFEIVVIYVHLGYDQNGDQKTKLSFIVHVGHVLDTNHFMCYQNKRVIKSKHTNILQQNEASKITQICCHLQWASSKIATDTTFGSFTPPQFRWHQHHASMIKNRIRKRKSLIIKGYNCLFVHHHDLSS